MRPVKGVGYKYELSLKSPTEGRYYNFDFRTSLKLTYAQVVAVIESLCDVEVKKFKEVVEFAVPDLDQVYNGVSLNLRTKLGGVWTRRNKVYLPRVKPTVSQKDILAQLKLLYGNELEITGFQERL